MYPLHMLLKSELIKEVFYEKGRSLPKPQDKAQEHFKFTYEPDTYRSKYQHCRITTAVPLAAVMPMHSFLISYARDSQLNIK